MWSPRLVLAPAVLVAIGLVGCGGDDSAEPTTVPASAPTVSVVSPEEGAALIADGATVIDVRTPAEFAAGHLADAELIDLQDPDFEARVRELDPDGTYVVYCRTGNRSAQAAGIMAQLGFTSVHDLGGIQAWEAAGLPVVTE